MFCCFAKTTLPFAKKLSEKVLKDHIINFNGFTDRISRRRGVIQSKVAQLEKIK